MSQSSYSFDDSTVGGSIIAGGRYYPLGQPPPTAAPFTFVPTEEQNEWFEYFNGAFIGGVLDCLSTTMAIANTPDVNGSMMVSWIAVVTINLRQLLTLLDLM
jgi:hypothetical protein